MEFAGNVSVVTGAASGMGKAIALGLASRGSHVVLADVNIEAATRAVAEITGAGGSASAASVDVTDASACTLLIEEVHRAHGRLDILVNSAGIGQVKLLSAVTETDWDRMIDINAKGVFFLSQAAIGIMSRQKSGRIINLASIAGRRGEALVAAYCPSKAAVISLTQSFAEEGAPPGVTVNAIAPGIVDTPFWKESDRQFAEIFGKEPGEHFAATVAKIPLGRAEVATDIVPMTIFLAGEGASYITGQTFNVDGGITFS